jgi:hypothetical protein
MTFIRFRSRADETKGFYALVLDTLRTHAPVSAFRGGIHGVTEDPLRVLDERGIAYDRVERGAEELHALRSPLAAGL